MQSTCITQLLHCEGQLQQGTGGCIREVSEFHVKVLQTVRDGSNHTPSTPHKQLSCQSCANRYHAGLAAINIVESRAQMIFTLHMVHNLEGMSITDCVRVSLVTVM